MKNSIEILKKKSFESRKLILKMGEHGGCFVGSAFSCIDIITYLYNEIIDNNGNNKKDYLFLSKGHAVPAIYATLMNLGVIEEKRIANYNTTRDNLYLHPNSNIKGISFHSGSLGHGIAIATGVALDLKIKGEKNNVFVIVGDGELDEGSNWEAILSASAQKLDNLIIIIDRNKFQANFRTEDLIPLENLNDKFKAFGAEVKEIDGHDFKQIDNCLKNIPFKTNKINVVIANTVRGKGIPSIENDWEQWYMEYDKTKYKSLLEELEQNCGEV